VKYFKLILFLIVGYVSSAQVASDRLGFISSTGIVPDNGLQIEAGHLYNGTDYSLLNLSTATGVVLRKGINAMLEIQIRLPEYYVEGFRPSSGLSTMMVKVGFAQSSKVKCSVLGGVGIANISGVGGLYMGMYIPMQVEINSKNRIRVEGSFHLLLGRENISGLSQRFAPTNESSGISLAFQQDIKDVAKAEIGLNSRFGLVQRKEFGLERVFNEVLYGTLATQVNITNTVALDAAVQLPLAIGENQPAVGNGFIIKGGISVLLTRDNWKKNKVKIAPKVY
jgi:hypothetical protein